MPDPRFVYLIQDGSRYRAGGVPGVLLARGASGGAPGSSRAQWIRGARRASFLPTPDQVGGACRQDCHEDQVRRQTHANLAGVSLLVVAC